MVVLSTRRCRLTSMLTNALWPWLCSCNTPLTRSREAPRPRPLVDPFTREDPAQKYPLLDPESVRFDFFRRDLELPGTGARSAEVPQFPIAFGARHRRADRAEQQHRARERHQQAPAQRRVCDIGLRSPRSLGIRDTCGSAKPREHHHTPRPPGARHRRTGGESAKGRRGLCCEAVNLGAAADPRGSGSLYRRGDMWIAPLSLRGRAARRERSRCRPCGGMRPGRW